VCVCVCVSVFVHPCFHWTPIMSSIHVHGHKSHIYYVPWKWFKYKHWKNINQISSLCGQVIQVQYSNSFTGYIIKVSTKMLNPDKCTLSLYTECTTSYSTEPIPVLINPYLVREAIGKHPHQCAHWWASIPTSCAYHNTRESSPWSYTYTQGDIL
jgi:hypothetical protein